MPRGPKKHLKRLNAPKHWLLHKLGGIFAPRPSSGPHKLRECLPLVILIRNRLKYALTYNEAKKILNGGHILVDGQKRYDLTYPAGFMDVITIPASEDYFRLLYDYHGKFILHRITKEEAEYKLCKVKKIHPGKRFPYILTTDGRNIKFPDPLIQEDDTVIVDIKTRKIKDFLKFETGAMCMITSGKNKGRIGTLLKKERHIGSFDIIHLEDSKNRKFVTRASSVFVIGKANAEFVSLPKGKGVRPTILEKQDKLFFSKKEKTEGDGDEMEIE